MQKYKKTEYNEGYRLLFDTQLGCFRVSWSSIFSPTGTIHPIILSLPHLLLQLANDDISPRYIAFFSKARSLDSAHDFFCRRYE